MEEVDNTTFSFEHRDSAFSYAKNLEETTKIQLLKCQNYFMEKEILHKLSKKKKVHYLSIIEKLARFDEILEGYEAKNVGFQAVLTLKEEELAEIHEKYDEICEENRGNSRLNEGFMNNMKRMQEELEEIREKLWRSEAENEELKKKKPEISQKTCENEFFQQFKKENDRIFLEKVAKEQENLTLKQEKMVLQAQILSLEGHLLKFEEKNIILLTNLGEKDKEAYQIIEKYQGEIAIKLKENDDLKRKIKETQQDFLKKNQNPLRISLKKISMDKKVSMDSIEEYEGSKVSQPFFDCEESLSRGETPKSQLSRKSNEEKGDDSEKKKRILMKDMKKLGFI